VVVAAVVRAARADANHARFLRRYGNLMVIIFRCETPLGAIAT
jgi:hypothetical protein